MLIWFQGRSSQLWLLAAVCGLSVALLISRLHYGFLPEDDPSFGYVAERTFHGELPNVDFYEDYTGGLSYLDALAFHLFGVRLISQRIMLLLFFVPWVATVWYLASRITTPAMTILVTLLSVVWSVPVYPCPFGSWYNLYFATFGTAALFRYLDTGNSRWICWTGVCCGLSFLAKITGLYFLAAAWLFLIYDEQNESAGKGTRIEERHLAYSVLITLILLSFDAALVLLVRSAGTTAHYYHFVLPGVAISLFLMSREWQCSHASTLSRLRRTARRIGLLSAGAILPVAVFLLPYIKRHAVGKWCSSIFLSSARLHSAAYPPMPNALALLCVPLVVVLWLNATSTRTESRRTINIALSIVLAVVLLVSVGRVLPSRLVWFSIAESLPIIIVIGVLVLWSARAARDRLTDRVMLLLTASAICSLIQLPRAAPVYFCFFLPLVVLSLIALAEKTSVSKGASSFLVPVFAFYLLFGFLAILPGQFYAEQFDVKPETRSTIPRAAGFIGEKRILSVYEEAAPEVVKHAGSAPIYAGPDAAEFYFLTGHKNATPIFLEFLAGVDSEPSRILATIDSSGVRTVVINHGGQHNPSGPPPAELLEGLRSRFPQSTVIGNFEIRWLQASD
jgi:hypothetical protein